MDIQYEDNYLHLARLFNSRATPQVQVMDACFFSNSTSDDTDEHQVMMSLADERRKRRIKSNRESARRSRARKKMYMDELWSRIARFQAVNRSIIGEINHVMEELEYIVHENEQLRKQMCDLQEKLKEMEVIRDFQ